MDDTLRRLVDSPALGVSCDYLASDLRKRSFHSHAIYCDIAPAAQIVNVGVPHKRMDVSRPPFNAQHGRQCPVPYPASSPSSVYASGVAPTTPTGRVASTRADLFTARDRDFSIVAKNCFRKHSQSALKYMIEKDVFEFFPSSDRRSAVKGRPR